MSLLETYDVQNKMLPLHIGYGSTIEEDAPESSSLQETKTMIVLPSTCETSCSPSIIITWVAMLLLAVVAILGARQASMLATAFQLWSLGFQPTSHD